jgi:BMFP domain-containing protein YqiC
MMTLIPNQQVNDIAEQITKKVMENLGKNFQGEFKKVEDEFKRMETYINSLENRIEQLEKGKTKEGELQDSDQSRAD